MRNFFRKLFSRRRTTPRKSPTRRMRESSGAQMAVNMAAADGSRQRYQSKSALGRAASDFAMDIGAKKKGGGHPECGTSGKKSGYAKCVPASKAARMTKKEKASAVRRKRAAQNKKGRGGKKSGSGKGKKPIRVSTKAKK